MSAGALGGGSHVQHEIGLLAPKFKLAVVAALIDANAAGYDAIIYETVRSRELARLYYARGRTVIPPLAIVTNAPDESYSWHGYGLAADVISKNRAWDQPPEWFEAVSHFFGTHGCKWGGSWTMKDWPHFQWGQCKPSPSSAARTLLKEQGMAAVWAAVGAI